MTSALPQTFANPTVDVARFPVTQPIDQMVAGLNAYQPLALMGYPSMLALLAAEARAGRLRVLPRRITTTSEPLLPEVRQALTESFCAPVANMYGTSEAGPMGVGCWRGPGIHLCDLVIVEPADPAVEVRLVGRLERQATGKVRRFRPLEAEAVSRPA